MTAWSEKRPPVLKSLGLGGHEAGQRAAGVHSLGEMAGSTTGGDAAVPPAGPSSVGLSFGSPRRRAQHGQIAVLLTHDHIDGLLSDVLAAQFAQRGLRALDIGGQHPVGRFAHLDQ